MRSTPRFLAFVVVVLAFASLCAAQSAVACSCARLHLESYRQADEAVVAKLVDVEEGSVDQNDFPFSVYTFEVSRSYKKPDRVEKGDTVRIRAGSNGASCGFGSTIGREMALLLQRADGRWSSGLCSRTSRARLRRLAARASGAARVSQPDDPVGCSAAA